MIDKWLVKAKAHHIWRFIFVLVLKVCWGKEKKNGNR